MKYFAAQSALAAVALLTSSQALTISAIAQPKALAASTPRTAKIMTPAQWYAAYDQILRADLCTVTERQQLESALSQGVSILLDPQLKTNIQNLLTSLVGRYDRAQTQFAQLPSIPQTEKLQKAYAEYFGMGHQLFSDYLKVVENPLASDPSSGTPLLTQLQPRKEQLANIKDALTKFDNQIRAQLGIGAYRG